MENNRNNLRFGIYTRLSDKREEDQTSMDRQEKACRELAESRGWIVVDTYKDENRSGWKRGVKRPGYERLLRDMQSGKIDGVIAWKLDRLGRNRTDHARLTDVLETTDSQLVLFTEPIDTTTRMGRAMLDIMAIFARMESENISMRVQSAWDEKVEEGKPHISHRPFGLTLQWEATDEYAHERDAIEEAATRILRGETANKVANDFNDRGILTSEGNQWSRATLVQMLTSPRINGKRVHNGEAKASKHIPTLLDDVTYRRLVGELTPKPKNSGGGEARYLLSTIVKCWNCENNLWSHKHRYKTKEGKVQVRAYQCQNKECKRGVFIKAPPLEDYITDHVMEELYGGAIDVIIYKARNTVGSVDLSNVRDEIASLRELLESLDHELADKEISMERYKSATRKIEEKIELKLDYIDAHSSTVELADGWENWVIPGSQVDYQQWWKDKTVRERRAVIRLLIDSVTISPATKSGSRDFDADRVEIATREIDDAVYRELANIFTVAG